MSICKGDSLSVGFPGGASVKNLPTNAGDIRDAGLIPGCHGNPLQYSCLENPLKRGAWRAMVNRVAELDTTEVTEHACSLFMPEREG